MFKEDEKRFRGWRLENKQESNPHILPVVWEQSCYPLSIQVSWETDTETTEDKQMIYWERHLWRRKGNAQEWAWGAFGVEGRSGSWERQEGGKLGGNNIKLHHSSANVLTRLLGIPGSKLSIRKNPLVSKSDLVLVTLLYSVTGWHSLVGPCVGINISVYVKMECLQFETTY